MATYFIGDVHGCYKELKELLNEISFKPQADNLWFCGDLVNKGPKSHEVISYIMDLPHANTVLGNHDMHLLALSQGLQLPADKPNTFTEVLKAPNIKDIITWLRSRPFLHQEGNNVLVHAGIYPTWSITNATSYSDELSCALQSDNWVNVITHMYGDTPSTWHDDLKETDRTRCLINIFTRMRFLTPSLELEFEHIGHPNDNSQLVPWYEANNPHLNTTKVFFGHWSMLNGNSQNKSCISIDGGCVYGGRLIAKKIS